MAIDEAANRVTCDHNGCENCFSLPPEATRYGQHVPVQMVSVACGNEWFVDRNRHLCEEHRRPEVKTVTVFKGSKPLPIERIPPAERARRAAELKARNDAQVVRNTQNPEEEEALESLRSREQELRSANPLRRPLSRRPDGTR